MKGGSIMSMDEIYSTALKNTLEEMRKVCPDIQHAFVYNANGEVVAGDADTPQKVMVHVIDAFDSILERAEAVGDVEAVTLNGSMGTVKLYHFNEHYFVMVYSAKADVNYVDTVVRVLVPTVLRLLEKISPTPLKNVVSPPSPTPKPETAVIEPEQPIEEPTEELAAEAELEEEKFKPEAKPVPAFPQEPSPFEPQAVQLIVENIGGLLVPSDTVRVDGETLSSWESMFEGKKIEYVEIETFDGKTARYKVKPIKDSKFYGKGIVQMPEKAQLSLEIKKGELVRVKPVIE
jgi:predicted regulator of Ras-like GTPase activity (Roadblock/LC7/MglB family)